MAQRLLARAHEAGKVLPGAARIETSRVDSAIGCCVLRRKCFGTPASSDYKPVIIECRPRETMDTRQMWLVSSVRYVLTTVV